MIFILFAGDMLSDLWPGPGESHHHPARLQHQETMHTDSGLDTEDICPATPTGGRFSATPTGGALSPVSPGFRKISEPGPDATATDDNLRMVLVRDIGIQCCAESPNLNLHRRSGTTTHRRSKSAEENAVEQKAERPNSLCAGKFQSELLF